MTRLKQNTGFIAPACAILLVILLSATSAGDMSKSRAHPDGVVGAFGIDIHGQYLSISSDKPLPIRDHQQLGFDLIFPVNTRLTFRGGYTMEPVDTLYHNAGVGLTLYSKGGGSEGLSVNPDGPIGGPVLSAGVSMRLKDDQSEDNRMRITARILVPTSAHLTLGAGLNNYDKDDPLIIDEYFGLVAWFIKRYDPAKPYINPDGLPGYPVFRFTGGGNSRGLFGQLDMVVPMSPRYSLIVWARGEKISDLQIKKLGLGVGVSLYPGNN